MFKWLSERPTVVTVYLLVGIIFVSLLERSLVPFLGNAFVWWLGLLAILVVTWWVLKQHLLLVGWLSFVLGLVVAASAWLSKQFVLAFWSSPQLVWAMIAFVFLFIAYAFISILVYQRSGRAA